jgi:hypothetical protein
MFASVGLEMACACRCWTAGTHRTIVALGAAPARRRLVRSIVGRVEEGVLEKTKERPIDGLRVQLTGWRESCAGGRDGEWMMKSYVRAR